MRFYQEYLIGFTLLVAGSVQASTIFAPTDQNVNFVNLQVSGSTTGLQLAMFDDVGSLSASPWLPIDYTGDVVDFSPTIGQNVNYTVSTSSPGPSNSLTLTGNDNFRLALRRGVPSDPDFIAWAEPGAVVCNGASHTCTLSWTMGATELAVDLTFSTVAPAEVPLPASAWLLGSGLLGLVGISRRKG